MGQIDPHGARHQKHALAGQGGGIARGAGVVSSEAARTAAPIISLANFTPCPLRQLWCVSSSVTLLGRLFIARVDHPVEDDGGQQDLGFDQVLEEQLNVDYFNPV